MDNTRNGKIARLPSSVRDELNQRLENGETERTILPWLNAQPAVQAALAASFGASPVNRQNLTNWRQGGYRQWLDQRERGHLVRDLLQDAKELAANPSAPQLADHVSTVFLVHLFMAARDAEKEPATVPDRFKRLHKLVHTVSEARRGDYLTGRLALERDRHALEQAKEMVRPRSAFALAVKKDLEAWLQDPGAADLPIPGSPPATLNVAPPQTGQPAPASDRSPQGESS